MTDEEILALAEKTKKEKFCLKFNNCWECPLFAQYGQISECCDSKYRGSFYKKIFLDGFKSAMKYFNQIIKELNTDGKFDDDFNYSGGYQRAFEDIEEKLGM